MTTAPVSLPQALREDDWKTWVMDVAILHGWRVSHSRPARTAKGWRTAVQGHIGAPDLLLARDGDVILAELKRNDTYPTREQREWLRHLGGYGCVWRPRDADTVLARLA